MATESKNIDPRFDPAFQRGYAQSNVGAPSDAVWAARTVDSLRDDAAAGAAVGLLPASRTGSDNGSDSASPVAGHPEQRDLAPQSHYVGAGGTLTETAPTGQGKSLARNPWLYVLWFVGAVATSGAIAGQLWAYSQLYGQTGPNVAVYGLITAIQGLAPIAATAGALSIVGALIVHALNWMRRNP